MTKALQELQKELLSNASIAIQLDVMEEWRRLKTDFAISIEMGSVYGLFKLSNYPYIIALFKNAVETGNQQLITLFFEAKLIGMESLVAGLYPEAINDNAQDSLFFTGMTYDLHRKDPLLLDLSFASISESELPSIITTFKELHIPTLEGLDKTLAEKLLVYFANKKYLDLTVEASTFPEEKRYQRALLLQITDFLLNRQELSESQVKFFQEYNNKDLLSYLISVINADHTSDEINTLLDSPYLKDTLEELKLQELNTFFYTARLKPLLESYEKNLLIFARKADFSNFEKNWETFLSLYQTYQQKVAKEFNFSNRIFTIFRETVKGGDTQIAELILKENISINFYYTSSKSADEPMHAYNMLALAAFNKNEAMLAFLLDKGININFRPQAAKGAYVSPLALAIQKESPAMVTLLLEKGINIWDKGQIFTNSPIFAAIIFDYQYANKSAYYSTLLFNQIEPGLIEELRKELFKEYFFILEQGFSKELAQWTLRFLLNKSYLDLEDMLLKVDTYPFWYPDYFLDPLLEKVLHLNLADSQKISKLHENYLSNFKIRLSKWITSQINADGFSPLEIEQLVKNPIIFNYLNRNTQELVQNTDEMNKYKNQPLSLIILKKIFESLDHSLKQEKDKAVRKILSNIHFYQEIRKLSDQIEHTRELTPSITDLEKLNLELNTDEIESLWIIIEDFKRDKVDQNPRYQQICTWAVKKLCSTSTLSVRMSKSESTSLCSVILPEQYQEKINQIKQVVNQLRKVCSDGEAVLAFMEHLLNDRNTIEQFFQEKYSVYYFLYVKDQKKYSVALHTENIPRGNLKELQNFIHRLIREYIACFDIAHRAGKSQEFFGQFSGLCIEGRLRNCFKWIASLDDLPTFDEIMQKAVLQYKAYTKVMEPSVLADIKNFPTNDGNEYDEEDLSQALAFIAPRIVDTPCFFEDRETGERLTKNISEADIEDYLKNILVFNEENDFVFLADPDPIVGYEIAAASKDIPVYAEQTPQKLRLNPTLVENLLLSYIEGFVSEKHKIEEGFVQTLGKYTIDTAYKKIYSAKNNLPIVVFQITRDSKKDDESRNLPFINDVILTFLSNNPEENMTLLMPMAQCRSQLGKNKKHYVLVEITLHGVNKEIVIHNSQSKSSTFAYFNCLKDLKGFKFTKHHTYHQQEDNFSCGLFVYRYIQSILELGSNAQLIDIRASLAAPCLSLDGIINDNLSRVINLHQKKIAASENLPWERKNLEKYLASENLDQDIDFPNKNDSSLSSLKDGVLPATDSPRTLFFARDLNKLPLEPATGVVEQKMSNGP